MKHLTCILILVNISIYSCKKFVDVGPPPTQLASENIFASDATAIAAQLAIYSRMESDNIAFSIISHTGMSSDEMFNHSTSVAPTDIYNNNIVVDNTLVLTDWRILYKYIYQCNAILEGLEASKAISASVKQQLTGESMFVRAFCHFYLTNFFGEIPLVSTTDYLDNSVLDRRPIEEVYAFIESDLLKASDLLTDNYVDAKNRPTMERIRPNKWVAQALLARLYLFKKDWANAELVSSRVIGNNSYQLVSNLDQVFLKGSTEAIFQWQNVQPNYNSYAGGQLNLISRPSTVSLDTFLIRAFRPNDKRKVAWTKSLVASGRTYYYVNKYKVRQSTTITEYTMVLRLGEQYLIRSEARARQNKLSLAESDLNAIRSRAGMSALNSITQAALLDSLQEERRFELFAEFGDRWFNLRRTGQADVVMMASKGSRWVSTDILYPVPLAEINRNQNLSQNPGY